MEIEGANVIVTGASSGIGAALGPMLAARGATVGLVARRADRLEEVLAECRVHTPESRAWPVDLADLDAAEELVHQAAREWGRVDCLVNNAGIPARIPVRHLTAADVAHVMDVNFHAPVRMSLALLPDWLARGSGCVVNVSSLGGRVPIANEAAYCASKFALCGWTEGMAVDLYGTGVEVKLVLPGPHRHRDLGPARQRARRLPGPVRAGGRRRAVGGRRHRGRRLRVVRPAEFPGGGPQHDIVVGKSERPRRVRRRRWDRCAAS